MLATRTAADLALARELGVDLVQGWFFEELFLTAGRPALPAPRPRRAGSTPTS